MSSAISASVDAGRRTPALAGVACVASASVWGVLARPAPPRSALRALAVAWLVGVALLPRLAAAGELEDLSRRLLSLEASIARLGDTLRSVSAVSQQQVERRLVDAQVLYELRDYENAAILLMDIVEKAAQSRAYPEALFLFADCLYHRREYLSAQRYYEKVMELGPQGRRYQEALQRLLEVSLHRNDTSRAAEYLSRLGSLGPAQMLPSVPYILGKYHYFRGQVDQALRYFASLAPGRPYDLQARYFEGTIAIARRDVSLATRIFEGLVQRKPRDDTEAKVLELAQLALGRLYYERGQVVMAIDLYGRIDRKSPLFEEALYETAWAHVKAKQFREALRALDLLLLANPDSTLAPEVRILTGNLHIRLGEHDQARKVFDSTREQFSPVNLQLRAILGRSGDPQRFFAELVGRNLGRFDVDVVLPPLAAKWVRADPEVTRLVQVVGDMAEIQRSLEEAEDLARRLSRAVGSTARTGIFPDLMQTRLTALDLDSSLAQVREKLIQRELASAGPAIDRVRLERLRAEEQALQAQLRDLPTSTDSYEDRVRKSRALYEKLEKEAAELFVGIESLRAQMVAMEKFYDDTRATQPITPEEFRRRTAETQALVAGMRQQHERLISDIADAKNSASIDDTLVREGEQARGRLSALQAQMHALVEAAGGVGPEQREIDGLLARAAAGHDTLARLRTRIDGIVDSRLADLRATLAVESARLAEYRQQASGFRRDSEDVGGGVTFANIRRVAERFYQVVVRADVGILDVAWALKQLHTDAIGKLGSERSREIRLIDDELREVLQEEREQQGASQEGEAPGSGDRR